MDNEDSQATERTIRIDISSVKRALLSPEHLLNLNIFEGEPLEVQLDDVQQISESNIIATGKIIGDQNSAVTLVLNGESFVANFRRGDILENYEIRYNIDGTHAVRKLTKAEDEACGAIHAPDSVQPTLNEDTPNPIKAFDQGSPMVSILAAYTPQARAQAGGTNGIRALIQMGVADTNKALEDSGAKLRVRLAGTMETRQNERGLLSTDLDALRGTNDGFWDEVHQERRRLKADQVTMIGIYTTDSSAGGVGYINAVHSTAFTIVKSKNFGIYTFSHELGHNLGLNHDDGYSNSQFRTIIAYGSQPRIRRYSNPARTYNGQPTGDQHSNEVRIINRNAARIANLM